MTLGHLAASMLFTGYIFVGTMFEERSLVAEHGETYERYRTETPKLLPWPRPRRRSADSVA